MTDKPAAPAEPELRTFLRDLNFHLEELADSWERGVLSSHDGNNGPRSNRNAELLTRVVAQRALLEKAQGEKK
jgi:hypothetical protein